MCKYRMKLKTIKVSEEVWAKIMKYRIALRHKNNNETLAYLLKRCKKNGKNKKNDTMVSE